MQVKGLYSKSGLSTKVQKFTHIFTNVLNFFRNRSNAARCELVIFKTPKGLSGECMFCNNIINLQSNQSFLSKCSGSFLCDVMAKEEYLYLSKVKIPKHLTQAQYLKWGNQPFSTLNYVINIP